MKLKKLYGLFVALAMIGCSSDDEGQTPEESIDPVDFVTIGEDANSVYQFTYDSSIDSGQTFNLTEEIGIATNYLTLRQVNDELSFYSFANGAFSLAQIDVNTRATAIFDDFYINQQERSIIWGINNNQRVFFSYFGPQDTRNLSLLDFQLENGLIEEVNVEFDVELVFEPLLFEKKVLISYLDNLGNYKIAFYNTESQVIEASIDFGKSAFSFFITASDELAVIKNGLEPTIELYDIDSYSFIESKSINLNVGFETGPINGTVLSNDRIFYRYAYPQPARIPYGPAIFDLNVQDNQIINISEFLNEIEQRLSGSVRLTTQTFIRDSNIFFIGYAVLGNEVRGGVMQISTDGQLIKNIELPFLPTYFVMD